MDRPAGLPSTVPAISELDQQDAAEISRAALLTIWTVDTVTDDFHLDAYLRAVPYLSPENTEELIRKAPQLSGLKEWSDHDAYARVRLIPDKAEPSGDTASATIRRWTIRVTPTGRDGWTGSKRIVQATVTLARTDVQSPWRVHELKQTLR